MIKTIGLTFAGGALGAILRELIMLRVPRLLDGFPLDILVANLASSFLLGLVSALHARQRVSHDTSTLLGTGVSGGLSTFSSFAYGVSVLIAASTADAVVAGTYVAISLAAGYLAVRLGLGIGARRPPKPAN